MLLPQHTASRTAPFGYTCRSCSACCPHKFIQVNPYEVARLARLLGLTTTQFREFYTEKNGAVLKRNDEDTCVFLSEGGCSVYPERPLSCRLYPLSRQIAPSGAEEWVRIQPHPASKGVTTEQGTIADWVESQAAQPFIDAADAYAFWVRDAYNALETDLDAKTRVELAANLLDMDLAITMHCTAAEIPEPTDIEERLHLHLHILYQTLGGHHAQ